MKKYIFAFLLCWTAALMAQHREGAGKYAIKHLSVNTENSDFGGAFYGQDKLVFASPKKGITIAQLKEKILELYYRQ